MTTYDQIEQFSSAFTDPIIDDEKETNAGFNISGVFPQ